MFLRSLSLLNFKNYTRQRLAFRTKLTCFTGPNGAGKTNLLDAIYYLCISRSFFNYSDQYNVRQEEDFFRLDGEIDLNDKLHELKCTFQQPRKKEVVVDDVKCTRLSNHVGRFPVVMVAPDDSVLINGASEERRKFIDTLISQLDRDYLEALQAYNKVLSQRNAWLKKLEDGTPPDNTMLETYNSQLVQHATVIFKGRQQYIDKLIPHFQEAYKAISGGKETVSLNYTSPLHERSLADWLRIRQPKDIILGRTTKGVHRDDLEFLMNGLVVKHFGSQGQQKSYLLSLKLAKYRILSEEKGIPPFLLLDDIFDKLDPKRCAHLLQYLNQHEFGQIFITDTQRSRIEDIFAHNTEKPDIFEVEAGEVKG